MSSVPNTHVRWLMITHGNSNSKRHVALSGLCEHLCTHSIMHKHIHTHTCIKIKIILKTCLEGWSCPLLQTSVSSLRSRAVDTHSLQEYYEIRTDYACEHVATERFYPLRLGLCLEVYCVCLLCHWNHWVKVSKGTLGQPTHIFGSLPSL